MVSIINVIKRHLNSTTKKEYVIDGAGCWLTVSQHTVTLDINITGVNITGGNTNNDLGKYMSLPNNVALKHDIYFPCVVMSDGWAPAAYGYINLATLNIRTNVSVTNGVIRTSHCFNRNKINIIEG